MKITFIILGSIMLSYFALTSISLINAQTANTTANTPFVEITSPEDGDQVPVGELTIEGTSSDRQRTDCQVYVDVNDIPPFQEATDEAPGKDDFEEWSFTYTEDYQLIKEGENELTAKISCTDNGIVSADWDTVNVTGIRVNGISVGNQGILPTNTMS